MRMFTKCLLMAGVIAGAVASAASMEWMTDLEQAGEKAAAEGKLLLVEFTGSDWCTACKVQKKKVLEKPEFTDWVQQHYVPVMVDVPNNAALVGGKARLQANKQICEDYGIKVFPALVVMTPELVPMGAYYGIQASPAAAITTLQGCNPAVERFRKTMALPAEQRADALLAMLNKSPESSRKNNLPLMRLIAEADADNSTGIRAVYLSLQQIRMLDAQLKEAENVAEKLAVIEHTLPQALPENKAAILKRKETLLRVRAIELLQAPASVADVELSRDFALQAVDCMTDETARTSQRKSVEQYYANPKALYQELKKKQPPIKKIRK